MKKTAYRMFALTLAALLMSVGSALAQDPGDVVITEVMFDPAGTDVGFEWIEIHNTTGSSIDIGLWVVTDGPSLSSTGSEGVIEIPSGTTIAADQYLVLSETALPDITGEIVCNQYDSDYTLGNTGDNLAIYTSSTGTVIIDGSLTMKYPALPGSGNGKSLEKCDVNAAWDSVSTAWHVSTTAFTGGGTSYTYCTPGAVNSLCADTVAPTLTDISPMTGAAILALFSEALDLTTSETEANYVVTPGPVSPSLATRLTTDSKRVLLDFSPALAPGTYTLTVNGVEDLFDNPCVNQQMNFVIGTSSVDPGDIVITEVMYDDTFSGTNDQEWVEIHNCTDAAVDISDWILTDSPTYPAINVSEGAIRVPSSTSIAAHQYLVLSKVAIAEFGGEVVCNEYDTTFMLGNGGDNLALYTDDSTGVLIDGSLLTQYPDSAADNTGKSVEKCDSCTAWTDLVTAWHASVDSFSDGRYQYCTPGMPNSSCVVIDTTRPTLDSAHVVNTSTVDVYFSEDVEDTTANVNTNYSVEPGTLTPSTAVRQGDLSVVRLTFSPALPGNTYTLTVNNVEDMYNNAILPGSQVAFVVPTIPAIIFTEIMPDPNFSGVADSLGEWFEIYNLEDAAVDISGWIIADNAGRDTIEGTVSIPSHDYFVFCSNGDSATNGGVPEDYAYEFGTSGWGLSLNNGADSLSLKTAAGILVAYQKYTTTFPWGVGTACQLKTLASDGTIDTNWCRADSVWVGATQGDNGTPGAATICAPNLPPAYRSICDLRSDDGCGLSIYNNTLVTTQGVVTYLDSCRKYGFIEQGGCAIFVYGDVVRENMIGSDRKMAVSDFVQVTGYVTSYNGAMEIAPLFSVNPTITFLSTGAAVPSPITLLPSQIKTSISDCSPEVWESRHVTLQSMTFVYSGLDSVFRQASYYLYSGTDTVVFYVHNCDTGLIGDTLPEGLVDITGILTQYDNTSCYCSGYQIKTGRMDPFLPSACQTPVEATVYRLSGDTVEVRWDAGVDPTCNCYQVYYADDVSATFPDNWTLLGCTCSGTTMRDEVPLVTKRFYRVTSISSCP